jgi:hypothetical protein
MGIPGTTAPEVWARDFGGVLLPGPDVHDRIGPFSEHGIHGGTSVTVRYSFALLGEVLVELPVPGDRGFEVGNCLRPGGRSTLARDPICEGFVQDCLELAALLVGDGTHFRQQFRKGVGGECGLHVHQYLGVS